MEPMFEEEIPGGTGMEDPFMPVWQRRWFRWAIGILAVLGLIGALAARPGWRAVKRWRGEAMIREAQQLVDRGEIVAGLDRCQAGLQLAPDHPEGLRLLAVGLARTTAARGAVHNWLRYLRVARPTPEDLVLLVEAAVREGLPEVAEPHVRTLLSAERPTSQALRAASFHASAVGRTREAIQYMRRAVAAGTGDATNRLGLARLLEGQGDSVARGEARELFRSLARDEGSPVRLDALERLLNGPTGERLDWEWIQGNLARLARPGVRERVLLAEASSRLDPSKARQTALEAVKQIGTPADDDLVMVVAWLHRGEMFDLSLPLLSPSRVRSHTALFAARLDALIRTGKAAAAYRELLEAGGVLEPVALELWRYRTALLLKDDAAADRHRAELLRVAGRDASRLRRVAEAAQASGVQELAEEAWKRLVGDPLEGVRALQSLADLSDAGGDTWGSRELHRRLLVAKPGVRTVEVKIAYLDLLLGENVAEATRKAEALIQNPEVADYARFATALGYLRQNDPTRARGMLGAYRILVPALSPAHRAVLAAVLGASGEVTAAESVAATVSLSRLRPEEKELVRPFLRITGAAAPGATGRAAPTSTPGPR